ncbi:MAG: hypothetical protein HFF50_10180 [Lawsonibacter sp.]|nr:hypothetical protein [Lawsonibacter sp.]
MLFGRGKRETQKEPKLTSTRWKELLDGAWSDVLEDRLSMRGLGNWCWAGPWEDHRRRVLRVWLQRSCTCGTIQWGWNFDFIPHLTSSGLGWRRTDKSVGLELFRVPEEYIDTARDRSQVMAGSWGEIAGEAAVQARDRQLLVQLLPRIEAYYRQTAAPEALLAETEQLQQQTWYRFTHGPQLAITRAFLLAALGRREEGAGVIQSIAWEATPKADQQRARLLTRLGQQEILWTGR